MAYTLDSIVSEYLVEKGLPENRRERIYANAVSGLREMSMDISAVPLSVEITINDNDTVDLPCGFLSYISVSIIGADGGLLGLGKNNRINTTNYFNDCGVPIRRLPPVNNTALNNGFVGQLANPTYLATHWRNGENIGGYFNAGGHNRIGSYKFDYTNNQIILSELRQNVSSIVLEYISDIQADNSDFTVHPYLIEAIKMWIDWKIGKGPEQYYRMARKLSVRRFQANTMQEILDAYRSSASGIPKW